MIFVKNIPQDTDFHKSFNVLVPLDIQGKECQLISKGGIAQNGRSMSHQIKVNNNFYSVPTWAIFEVD